MRPAGSVERFFCACFLSVLATAFLITGPVVAAEKISCGDVRSLVDIDWISPEQVQGMLMENRPFVLIDVREPEEFAESHIDGAVNMPRGNIIFHAPVLIADPAEPIVIYCLTSPRSVLAARTLRQMGYSNVTCMSGGYEAWQAYTCNARNRHHDS